MPTGTLIRNRGKRGNRAQKSKELTAARKEAQLTQAQAQHKKSKNSLSYLERLPAEVLQTIFIESENADLANVSVYLRNSVLSDYTKAKLVYRCFRGSSDNQEESEIFPVVDSNRFVSEEFPRHLIHRADRLKTLLGQPWMTCNLLEHVMKDWMIRQQEPILRDFLKGTEDFREAFDKAKLQLQEFNRLTFAKQTVEVQRELQAFCGSKAAHSQPTFQISSGDRTLYIGHFRPIYGSDVDLGWVWICQYTPNSLAKMYCRHFIPWASGYQHIHPSLCRGPFTQSKGDLLTYVLENVHYQPKLTPRQQSFVELMKVAGRGLDDALSELCLPAVYCLAGGRCELENIIRKHGCWARPEDSDVKKPLGSEAWSWFAGRSSLDNQARRADRKAFMPLHAPFRESHLLRCIEKFGTSPHVYTDLIHCFSPVLESRDSGVLSNDSLNALYQLSQTYDEHRKPLQEAYRNLVTRRQVHNM